MPRFFFLFNRKKKIRIYADVAQVLELEDRILYLRQRTGSRARAYESSLLQALPSSPTRAGAGASPMVHRPPTSSSRRRVDRLRDMVMKQDGPARIAAPKTPRVGPAQRASATFATGGASSSATNGSRHVVNPEASEGYLSSSNFSDSGSEGDVGEVDMDLGAGSSGDLSTGGNSQPTASTSEPAPTGRASVPPKVRLKEENNAITVNATPSSAPTNATSTSAADEAKPEARPASTEPSTKVDGFVLKPSKKGFVGFGPKATTSTTTAPGTGKGDATKPGGGGGARVAEEPAPANSPSGDEAAGETGVNSADDPDADLVPDVATETGDGGNGDDAEPATKESPANPDDGGNADDGPEAKPKSSGFSFSSKATGADAKKGFGGFSKPATAKAGATTKKGFGSFGTGGAKTATAKTADAKKGFGFSKPATAKTGTAAKKGFGSFGGGGAKTAAPKTAAPKTATPKTADAKKGFAFSKPATPKTGTAAKKGFGSFGTGGAKTGGAKKAFGSFGAGSPKVADGKAKTTFGGFSKKGGFGAKTKAPEDADGGGEDPAASATEGGDGAGEGLPFKVKLGAGATGVSPSAVFGDKAQSGSATGTPTARVPPSLAGGGASGNRSIKFAPAKESDGVSSN